MGREVLQEEGHPVADIIGVGQVVVVEDQPDVARCCGELVEQRREHKIGRHGGGPDEFQRTRADAGNRRLERGHDVCPEPRGLVVRWVQRHPCHGTVLSGCLVQPLSEERRFAEPRRGGKQRQPRGGSATQTVKEPRACHQTRSNLRDVQLRCNQRTCHVILVPRCATASEVCVAWLTLLHCRVRGQGVSGAAPCR